MLCRSFRARAESGHRSQGVALGCCSVPQQGSENTPRIGLRAYSNFKCGTGFQPVNTPARCRCHTILG